MLTSEYQFIGRSNAVTCLDGYPYYILLYARAETDTARGGVKVFVKQRLVCQGPYSFYGWCTSSKVSVNGQSVTAWSWDPIPGSDWGGSITEGGVTYGRHTDISEGELFLVTGYGAAAQASISASWVMDESYGATWFPKAGTYATVEATVALPMVAGATVPTVTGTGELGKILTISTAAQASGFTHKLTWKFGSQSGVIAEAAATGASWTPDISLAAQIPNAVSGAAVITCTTYQGTAVIGEPQSVSVTLTVPASVVPTASASWTDTSGAYSALGVFTQNVTKLSVEVTGTGAQGSSITAAAVTLGGKSYTGGVITDSGSLTLTVTVTDSRGRTGSRSYTVAVAPYAAPQLTLSASRCDASGNADDTGEYAAVTLTGETVQVNGQNTAALTLSYGSASQSICVAVGAFSETVIIPAPSTASLSISAVLSDRLLTASRSMTLSTGYATMDLLKGGKGIALGKSATREGLDCAMPAYFSQGINGVYIHGWWAMGTPTTRLKTTFADFSGDNTRRQHIFLFGSANMTHAYGLLTVASGGNLKWTGSITVTVTAEAGGVVALTMPSTCWDLFVGISADSFNPA